VKFDGFGDGTTFSQLVAQDNNFFLFKKSMLATMKRLPPLRRASWSHLAGRSSRAASLVNSRGLRLRLHLKVVRRSGEVEKCDHLVARPSCIHSTLRHCVNWRYPLWERADRVHDPLLQRIDIQYPQPRFTTFLTAIKAKGDESLASRSQSKKHEVISEAQLSNFQNNQCSQPIQKYPVTSKLHR
jgi:hypothetical protein